jgi:hypothetical protein
MAGRKPSHKAPLPDLDAPPGDEERELEDFEELDQVSAHVMVYRCGRPGEQDAFVDTIPAAGITPTLIRDSYGPGKYRLRCKGPGKKYLGQKTIVVGELRINAPGSPLPQQAGVPSVIDAIRDENRRQSELIQTLIATQKPPSFDFAGMAAILTALKPAGNGHGPASSPEATLEVFFKGFELARKMEPAPAAADNGEWKTMLTSVAKEVLPGILAMGGGGGAPPRPPQLPPAQPAQPAVRTEPMKTEIQMIIAQVKEKCLAQVPPDLYIGLVQAYASEPNVQRLIAFVYANEFDNILTIDPSLANEPFRSYFRSLYDGLRQLFKPSDSVDDDSTGPGGDQANPASNGGLGKAG